LRWFLLAERAGHLVAFAECNLSSSPPLLSLSGGVELVRLYVQAPSQRSGVGAALLARVEAHARRCGAPLLWLTAWVGNTNALAFYWAQGYEEVGSTCYAFEAKTYENRIYRKILTNTP
jgi:diamine N-acetyltransferase